jgi:hypothetical protein
VTGEGVRYGVVTLRRPSGLRRYAVRAEPGRAPRYCQGATWKLVPASARDRIEWDA